MTDICIYIYIYVYIQGRIKLVGARGPELGGGLLLFSDNDHLYYATAKICDHLQFRTTSFMRPLISIFNCSMRPRSPNTGDFGSKRYVILKA